MATKRSFTGNTGLDDIVDEPTIKRHKGNGAEAAASDAREQNLKLEQTPQGDNTEPELMHVDTTADLCGTSSVAVRCAEQVQSTLPVANEGTIKWMLLDTTSMTTSASKKPTAAGEHRVRRPRHQLERERARATAPGTGGVPKPDRYHPGGRNAPRATTARISKTGEELQRELDSYMVPTLHLTELPKSPLDYPELNICGIDDF